MSAIDSQPIALSGSHNRFSISYYRQSSSRFRRPACNSDWAEPIVRKLFDFTLGTHPISTKRTSEIGGAKRRSDFEFYTEPPWFFNPDFFCEFLSIGLLSFQGDFLRWVDEPIHDGFGDHRIFKQFHPQRQIDDMSNMTYTRAGGHGR